MFFARRGGPADPQLERRRTSAYVVLAAIHVIIIFAALTHNTIVMSTIEEEATIRRAWLGRLESLQELQQLAQGVDEAVADIYSDDDISDERAKINASIERFGDVSGALRASLSSIGERNERETLRASLDDIQREMTAVTLAAHMVLAAMARDDVATAHRVLSSVDRSFSRVMDKVTWSTRRVEQIQLANVERQVSLSHAVRRVELVIAFAIIVIVGLVASYGARTSAALRTSHARARAALEALGEAHNRLARYADSVSHELRGPVSKMRLALELALSRERSPEEYRGGIEASLEDCEHLSSVIDGLLFLARAKTPDAKAPMSRTDVNVRAEFALIADYFSAAAEKAGVSITVTTDEIVFQADRTLFQRAVANVVSNALSSTRRGGAIVLSAARDATGVTVKVEDTGVGIPRLMQASIFDGLHSAPAVVKADGAGLGLGLPITRAIVELHGGTVTLESEEGTGTQVTLSFPCSGPCSGPCASEQPVAALDCIAA